MAETLDFFAASNSGNGFFSFFNDLYGIDTALKVGLVFGGPGTGKSSLCRQVGKKALAAGGTVELIHCSSDPDSLDGVICREAGMMLLDATPPHTVAPKLAGVIENMVDVGAHWDAAALAGARGVITDCTLKIKERYGRVYKLLGCAARSERAREAFASAHFDAEKCARLQKLLAKRFFEENGGEEGRIDPRFLTGITPRGIITYETTVNAAADTVFLFRDPGKYASEIMLGGLAKAASEAGYDCWLCFDPLLPERPRQLIIKKLRIAFVCEERMRFPKERVFRLRRFYDLNGSAMDLAALYETITEKYVASAVKELSEIKRLHDRLESMYIPAMDFAGVNALTERTSGEYLSKLPPVQII